MKLCQKRLKKKLELGETISGTKEDIVMAASIKSAQEQDLEVSRLT
jgi:hypothetical protein